MSAAEKDLCDAIARAIGALAAIERAAQGGDPLGPMRDVRVRAQHAQRDLIRALGSTPMGRVVDAEALLERARNAGAA